MSCEDCDPVGVQELAERLGVAPVTPHAWLHRNLMPEPEFIVSGNRAWRWSTILLWAGQTGRIASTASRAEYEHRFGEPPAPHRKGGRPKANTNGATP